MAERRSRRSPAREAATDGSRGSGGASAEFRAAIGRAGPAGTAVLVLGVTAGLLMIVTEFATLFSVEVGRGGLRASCEDLAGPTLRDDCVKAGGEQHAYALILVGLLALLMAFGAGLGRSRPAAAALLAAGAVVLGIALLGDLPDSDRAGQIGENFTDAKAEARWGLWLEMLAGALAIAAGALRFLFPGARR